MAKRLANKGRRSAPKTTKLGTQNYHSKEEKIKTYQKYIEQEEYLDFAIERIAVELTHFLMK